jgi:hypothetical protein
MLRLRGLAEQGRVPSYWPWPDENGAGVGQPTALTLWIDKRAWIVVRSEMSAQLYKVRAAPAGVSSNLRVPPPAIPADNHTSGCVRRGSALVELLLEASRADGGAADLRPLDAPPCSTVEDVNS